MTLGQPTPRTRVGILALCPPPYGGVTRIVENHLALWPRDEIASYFLPVLPPVDAEPPAGAEFHRLIEEGGGVWNGPGAYARVLARAPITGPHYYINFLRYNRALSKFIQTNTLDVLYAHGTWPAGASAILQSHVHGIPTAVVTYGETYGTTPAHRRWRRMSRYVVRRATRIVSTSEHCRRGALALGAPVETSSVIYAGVDTQRFHPRVCGESWRDARGIPRDATVVSVLGHVLRRKLDVFLDATSAIHAPGKPVCLIGGRGVDEAYVRGRLAGIGGPRVELLGFVPEEELPEFYAASDILVVSPNTLLECMGQSMKEAMAAGTPVVGANLGGVPEAIEDGVSGLLYDPENPTDLARAISALAGDPGRRRRMGEAARATVLAKFGTRVAAEQTADVLRAAITQVRGGR